MGWHTRCCGQVPTYNCVCCAATPGTISVTISGVSGGDGGICSNANGTYVLDVVSEDNCSFGYDAWIVDPFRLKVQVGVTFYCSGSDVEIIVSFEVLDSAGSKGTGWGWTKTVSGKPIDCTGEQTGFTESSITTSINGDACDTTWPTLVLN